MTRPWVHRGDGNSALSAVDKPDKPFYLEASLEGPIWPKNANKLAPDPTGMVLASRLLRIACSFLLSHWPCQLYICLIGTVVCQIE